MMKSAKNRLCDDLAESLNGAKHRRILGEREMRPSFVVIGGISGKDPAQVSSTEYDDVIEAFPADRAN